MNFYEFYDPADETTDNPVLQAAICLSEAGYLVVPTKNREPVQRFKDGVKNFTRLRKMPLNKYSLSFYFDDESDVAILMGTRRGAGAGEKLECIDVDCKADQHGYLWNSLAAAIEYCLPDVWEKLIIEKTKNDGRHIYYMCAQTTTKEVLARRVGTPDEIAEGKRERGLIELIGGERMLVTISPTPGYHFIKGNPTEIACITIEERAELLAICRSFTEISSIDFPKLLSSYRRKDPDTPWNQFNSKHGYEYIMQRIQAAGWEPFKEHEDRIYVTKPGASKEKTSAVISKQDHFMWVFSSSSDLPCDKRLSPFDIVKFYDYDNDFEVCAKALGDTGQYGVWQKDEGEFHIVSENGKIAAQLARIEEWLRDIGIRKYYPNKKELDYRLVQIVDNKVSFIDETYLKKIFLERIKKTCEPKVYEYFLGQNGLFKEGSNLMATLDPLPHKFLRSTKTEGYIFFLNTIVRVTSKGIECIPYGDNTKFIWESQILKREFSVIDYTECDTQRFIRHLAGSKSTVVDMYETMIGYMLHSYKSRSLIKCPGLIDQSFNENEDDDIPSGRTGKGLVGQLLSQFKNVVIDDGKTFDPKDKFCWQRAKIDTEVYIVDDVPKNFAFEVLFSRLTDDFIIEQKYKDSVSVPYEMSPKILFTGNYGLRGSGDSFADRQYQLEVYPYFSPARKPVDEFGYELIVDWDTDEWQRFNNYFLACLQKFLSVGFANQALTTLPIKTLQANTNKDFLRWIESVVDGWTIEDGILKPDSKMAGMNVKERFYKNRFLEKFWEAYPEYKEGKFKVQQSLFSRWLSRWAKHHEPDGLEFSTNNTGDQLGTYYLFLTKHWKRKKIFGAPKESAIDSDQLCDKWPGGMSEDPF